MTLAPAAVIAGALFPGPRSENETWVRGEFQAVLDQWFDWRKRLFADDPCLVRPSDRLSPERLERREILSRELAELCETLTAETPTYTPRYIGHMKAEVSLPAVLGWLAAMLHNPNNTSREASKVGTVIEAQAIAMLADMVGYDPATAEGHFTSGGTVANFEAVWRARYRLDHWLSLGLYVAEKTGEPLDVFAAAHMGWDRFRALWIEHDLTDAVLRRYSAAVGVPADIWRRIGRASGRDYQGPVLLVPGNKHYSWSKAANLFGLGEESLWAVDLDAEGRLDVDDLERLILRAEAAGRPVLMVVGVAGTTETGEIDPIDVVHDRLERLEAGRGLHIWRHVDAAYGGFLCAIPGGPDEAVLTPASVSALRAIRRADSVTIDPHKLGYVPYACGAFLTRDTARYAVSAFDAPYLDRPELGDGKWSSTLEGSRSAAGAAATWLSGRTIGFGPSGLGALLAETVRTRQAFEAALGAAVPEVRFLRPADANIVCFSVAGQGESLSSANARTAALFDLIHHSPDFSVSKTTLGADYAAAIARHVDGFGGVVDAPGMVLVRCVFMNPYWAAPEFREALFPPFIALVRESLDRPLEAAA
ncbi:pyridoxal phosphate-dependent decarboxylase family protein [Brevundimonas sp.]|uniref:pyridoxal phosphate-dependent decarboxylase family protein n=1 Tax=Brevundimonas sp. TaxID=1871086 RepID=UPI002D3C7B02|nr:pyridoxal-dependent decarboxylase [Brevundimonas sp.]HYD27058.1 pyridoxal-dependent decarboxylase [Brevundimonas sp.]